MGVILPVPVAWALIVALASVAHAAGGDLDTTFGGDGRVVTGFTGGAAANGVAIQADGKIVAVGTAGGTFGVARYDTLGGLDPTFSGDGRVTTDFSGGDDGANGVAIQADGKIVAVGHADHRMFALARYDSEGTLDPTFGGDGRVTTNFHPGIDIANAVAVQPNGKIVVAGMTRVGIGSGFAVARYKQDGTRDTTFGGDGRVVTQFFHVVGNAYGVAVQPNGKIVAVGEGFAGGGFALARYLPHGSLDGRFGGDGKVITQFRQGGGARAVALQPDGRIVAAGSGSDIFGPFALARYTRRGRLDPTFGGDGRVTANMGSGEESAGGVAIQTNGRIVAVGYAGVPHEFGNPGSGGIAVARFRANGRLDPTFGGDGKVRTHFSVGMALGRAVAIQTDGRIVAVGWAGERFVLARYLAS